MRVLAAFALLALARPALGQDKDIARYFKGCRRRSPTFDACVMKGLNSVQHLFKRGLPELGVPPFDPFHADEVVQKRGGSSVGYRLVLKDVYEHGWTRSFIDRFKSDLGANRIEYSQYFPEKWLTGRYEMQGAMLRLPITNKGLWNITLYDYNQTTVIARPAAGGPLRVRVHVTHIGDMSLHVSNLLRGRAVVEGLLDRMINGGAWRAGLPLFLPLVDDLVSTAFTAIFDSAFRRFPFEAVFPE